MDLLDPGKSPAPRQFGEQANASSFPASKMLQGHMLLLGPAPGPQGNRRQQGGDWTASSVWPWKKALCSFCLRCVM